MAHSAIPLPSGYSSAELGMGVPVNFRSPCPRPCRAAGPAAGACTAARRTKARGHTKGTACGTRRNGTRGLKRAISVTRVVIALLEGHVGRSGKGRTGGRASETNRGVGRSTGAIGHGGDHGRVARDDLHVGAHGCGRGDGFCASTGRRREAEEVVGRPARIRRRSDDSCLILVSGRAGTRQRSTFPPPFPPPSPRHSPPLPPPPPLLSPNPPHHPPIHHDDHHHQYYPCPPNQVFAPASNRSGESEPVIRPRR